MISLKQQLQNRRQKYQSLMKNQAKEKRVQNQNLKKLKRFRRLRNNSGENRKYSRMLNQRSQKKMLQPLQLNSLEESEQRSSRCKKSTKIKTKMTNENEWPSWERLKLVLKSKLKRSLKHPSISTRKRNKKISQNKSNSLPSQCEMKTMLMMKFINRENEYQIKLICSAV